LLGLSSGRRLIATQASFPARLHSPRDLLEHIRSVPGEALHALVLGARRADDLPRAAPEPRPVAIAVDEDAAVADHVGEEQRRVLSLIRRDELGPTPTRLVKRVDQIGASSMIVPAETYEYVQVTVGLLRASGDASEQDSETDVRLLSQRFHQTGDERPVRTDITTLLKRDDDLSRAAAPAPDEAALDGSAERPSVDSDRLSQCVELRHGVSDPT
jgi:hypothetical protein